MVRLVKWYLYLAKWWLKSFFIGLRLTWRDLVGLVKWHRQSGGPPPPSLPPPIADREGMAGGIECIVIDGKRWFYGFDSFGDQLIITPLIDDPDMMAAFASRYMRSDHRLAPEAPAYWRQAVDRAIDGTEPNHIVSEPFSTEDFRRIAASLKQAAADNRPVPGFTIPESLLDLLSVATGFERPSDMSANVTMQAKFGFYEGENDVTCACLVVDMLAGREPLAPGATYAAAATYLRGYLADMVNRAPGNWKTMFQELIAP